MALKGAPLVAQRVKDLPAKQETQETQVQSQSWEDPLEKEGKKAKAERVSDPSIGGERREWLATIHMSQTSQS